MLPLILSIIVLCACGESVNKGTLIITENDCTFPDSTLRVGTLYSPGSFFIYRNDSFGYDYELVKRFASDMGLKLNLTVGRSLPQLIQMLDSGKIDLIAYEVPITAEYAEVITPCGYENITTQVLVQRDTPDKITDVTDLPGREVYVLRNSKYHHRLRNLNSELGGGIAIHTLDPDSLSEEDMIEMVSSGELPLIVVDSDIAKINGTYFANIDWSVNISLEQRASWGVAPDRLCLADSIDSWIHRASPSEAQKDLLKRYFQLSKIEDNPYSAIDFTDGRISQFDRIFKQYAPTIGWDWRLLAAQAYTESRFNPTAKSFAGARGLMQIMPRIGQAYGLSNANNPEQSVATAVKLLQDLDRRFSRTITDEQERLKFVLASYNGGIGHIQDAMRLAEKHGLNPLKWDGNVAETVKMLTNPAHYNDKVVKYGYIRGRETTEYVDRILHFYEIGRTAIPV